MVMFTFLKNLWSETVDHGQLLVAYVASQLPYVTSMPGFATVLKTALVDRTPAALIDLGVQVIMGIAAGIKAKQIVVGAVNKTV